LHLADADGDGKGEVYLGEHLGAFRKISHEGKVLWSNWRPKPPKGGDRPFVSIVKHADIDGDGVSELLVGQRDGRFLVMDLAGKEKLWMEGRVTAPQWAKLGFTQAKAIDLDGDGKKEIYITTGRKAAAVFSHDGKKLLAGSAGWNCRDARFEDVTGDGVPEILSQCGYPGFKVLDKDLKASYDFVVAPKSLGWYVGDIQGDKRPEIVIAASSGYLLCFDGLGGRPWTRHAGDYLSAFTTIQSSNGQTVLVGATDDGDLIFLNTQAKLLKRLKVTEVGIAGVFPAELNGKPGDEILATTRDGKIVAVSSSGL
jgi:hypothetical protein